MQRDEQTGAAGRRILVIGPFGTVPAALSAIADHSPDVALLDVDLRGETSEPIAEALSAAGCAFVVVSAFETVHLGPALATAPLLSKPFSEAKLRRTLEGILRQRP